MAICEPATVTHEAKITTPSERMLASKAPLIRCWNGGRRDEMLRIARHLFAEGRLIAEGGIDSYAVWDVIAVLSYCDDYDTAERAIASDRPSVRTVESASHLANAGR